MLPGGAPGVQRDRDDALAEAWPAGAGRKCRPRTGSVQRPRDQALRETGGGVPGMKSMEKEQRGAAGRGAQRGSAAQPGSSSAAGSAATFQAN